MSRTRSIIAGDEIKSCESLRKLLTDFVPNIEVCAVCYNVSDSVKAIAAYKPQIVFLDIQICRETGFDLLTSLKDINFEIVFTTVYSEYALEAFKFSAIDYLLKPVNIDDLIKAVQKAERRISQTMNNRLENLMNCLSDNSQSHSKLALPTSDGIFFVRINEIVYCAANSNYTEVHMLDGKKYLVGKTLKEYDEILSCHDFFRIHHTYLANLELVKAYIRGEGGHVIMSNDITLNVSKRRKEAFLEKMAQRT